VCHTGYSDSVGWERTSFFIAALRWRDTVAMSARLFNLVLEKNRRV
jgi:hypothetical protein